MQTRELATSVPEVKYFSSLKIKFDCGLSDNGRSIVKYRTYSHIKNDAKALDGFNVANPLASLQQHSILDIEKIGNTGLSA